MAVAFRSGTSDDFNNPGGGAFIFVNWAFTDTPNNFATSNTVDMVPPGGGVPNLIGTGAGAGQRIKHVPVPLRRLLPGRHRPDRGRRQLRRDGTAVLRGRWYLGYPHRSRRHLLS